MSHTPTTDLYRHVITERLGLPTVVLPSGNIMFRNRGVHFIVHNHGPADLEFLHVTLEFSLTDDVDPQQLTRTLQDVSLRSKGCKALAFDGVLHFAAEMVLASPDCLPSADLLCAVLPRVQGMLLNAAERFRCARELAGIERATTDAEDS